MNRATFHIFLLASFLMGLATPVTAQSKKNSLELGMPLKCEIGKDCFVQHYIDMDPTKGAADYTCGSLTYDNHRGTDIRVKTVSQIDMNIPVIASADGIVGNLRDGIADQYFSDHPAKKQKEIYNIGLGNVVILNHGKGWSTFYAHLKDGTITVSKGQNVKKGDILGYVGMSGLTDFPHLHFELRHNKKRIDPFSGLEKGSDCGKVARGFWSKQAIENLSYASTGFMVSGFSETRPKSRKDLESGNKAQIELNAAAPTLFFWSYYIGSRHGDVVHLKITGPDGSIITENTSPAMTKHQISRYVFGGKKRPASGWRPGLYRGEISISRDGTLLKDSAVITVK